MPDADTALVAAAVAQARLSHDTGGMPIGAAISDPSGAVVSEGHNRMLFPSGDIVAHAELNAIRDLGVTDLRGHTLATTMPPCWMCGGAARHFGLSRLLVVRQPWNSGAASWLDEHGAMEVVMVDSPEVVELFEAWRSVHPERWPNPRVE